MTRPGSPVSAARRAHRPRSGLVLGTLAVLLAVWLGLSAPSVSPVTPAPGPPAGAIDQSTPVTADPQP